MKNERESRKMRPSQLGGQVGAYVPAIPSRDKYIGGTKQKNQNLSAAGGAGRAGAQSQVGIEKGSPNTK